MSETVLVNQEVLSETTQIKTELLAVLDKLSSGKETSDERRKAQKKIIESLPDDMYEDFKATMQLPNEDGVVTTSSDRSRAHGFLFEELVKADTKICGSKETPLATTLRSFMHSPARYGLDKEFHRVRNPDLAMIDENGKITGWVEVKFGPLNTNSIDQLGHFEDGFRYVLSGLQKFNRGTLVRQGLKVVADNIYKLKFSNTLSRRLAVPFGEYQNSPDSLMSKDLSENQRVELRTVLNKNYKIRESQFTREEVIEMSEYLYNKIKITQLA